jgi:cell wall-associated NlpC family hydrolase
MRPIRLLILLLAIVVAVVFALLRPLQGRAGRTGTTTGTQQTSPVPLRRRHLMYVSPVQAPKPFGRRVVTYARHFLGIRYSWGGTSPQTGFDCSGLVRFVYGHFGISLPHSSFGDLVLGHRVSRRRLRPGDLVFFADASHVGIYAGHGSFIDAPHTGADVRVSTMASYGYSYYTARRVRG